ncbi:hypothetical protein QUA35_30030 [Microcoleus sp. N9_B2]|uniref:hypothetical protein n=1 Tax=unclassified Microcoleus TaxID=2642155 RepID=UPI002FD0B805
MNKTDLHLIVFIADDRLRHARDRIHTTYRSPINKKVSGDRTLLASTFQSRS